MTKNQIIEKIARTKSVEKIVHNIAKYGEDADQLKDLNQYIYFSLLTKPEELVQHLYSTNTLNFYIARIVLSQIHSNSSNYAIERQRRRNYREISYDV